MNKKFLIKVVGAALAVGGASFSPAFAETANVNVYGTADLTFENVKAGGSTAAASEKPARNRVSTNSSNLGFISSADLGGGTKALFRFEQTLNFDTGGFGSAREQFAGVSFPGVGAIKLGFMSAAARWISGYADFAPGASGIQSAQSVISQSGGSTGANAQFNSRLANTFGFESAKWGGFSVRAYYGAGENKSNDGVAIPLDDKTFSVGAEFGIGSFKVAAAHEIRHDKGTLNNVATNDTKDTDTRVAASFTFPSKTTIAMIVDRMEFEDNSSVVATQMRTLEKSGWQLGFKQVIGGNHEIYGSYGQADSIEGKLVSGAAVNDADTEAKHFTLGYNYIVSKQMMYKVFYSNLKNEARARYDFDVNGISPAAGADPHGFGFGMRYTF